MGEAKILLFAYLNIIFSPWRAPSSHMASLLRLGGGLVAKSSPLLSRSPSAPTEIINLVAIPARNASSEEKAAKKKAVAQALDKEMREKHGIISHDEGMKDFTQYETCPSTRTRPPLGMPRITRMRDSWMPANSPLRCMPLISSLRFLRSRVRLA